MRPLTEKEKSEMRRRCFGLPHAEAIIEGGRWLAERMILHWTSEDVAGVLFGKPSNRRFC